MKTFIEEFWFKVSLIAVLVMAITIGAHYLNAQTNLAFAKAQQALLVKQNKAQMLDCRTRYVTNKEADSGTDIVNNIAEANEQVKISGYQVTFDESYTAVKSFYFMHKYQDCIEMVKN